MFIRLKMFSVLVVLSSAGMLLLVSEVKFYVNLVVTSLDNEGIVWIGIVCLFLRCKHLIRKTS